MRKCGTRTVHHIKTFNKEVMMCVHTVSFLLKRKCPMVTIKPGLDLPGAHDLLYMYMYMYMNMILIPMHPCPGHKYHCGSNNPDHILQILLPF